MKTQNIPSKKMRYPILIALTILGCATAEPVYIYEYVCSTRQDVIALQKSSDTSECIKIMEGFETVSDDPAVHLGGIRPVTIRQPDGSIIEGWIFRPRINVN